MLRAVVGALVKSIRRDLAGFASLKTNNFFLFVALLIWGALVSGVEPVSSYPFLFVLGVMMLFPASGDPLEKIPRVRLALWPLARGSRAGLRIAALLLSPIVWLLAVLLAVRGTKSMTLGFLGFVVAARACGGRLSFAGRPMRPASAWPPLFMNGFRQMFTVLDTYLALLIGAAGGLWRLLAAHADPGAFPILALAAAVALSTYAQNLFAFDGEPGLTRYRLLPLRGWRVILAKDAAFCAVLLIAVIPLNTLHGMSFGLAALALGRYPSLRTRLPQQRWRFTSGRVLWGVLQGIVGGILGFGGRIGIAAVLYAISLWWAGREWDRRLR
ncbi:MAG TPA: hypothetical protein VMH28_10335 [Candidatus Acidoferrales bacterium]|nr:hypothetical protein [Candidatus Acidoferrales bacterium]